MNPIDICCACLLAGLTAFGLTKGCVRIVVFIGSLICGLLAARVLYYPVSIHLREYIRESGIRDIAAFLVVFFAVLVVFQVAGRAIHALLQFTWTAWLDRLVGGVLGGAAGLLISNLLLVLAASLPEVTGDWMRSSTLMPWIIEATTLLQELLPPGAWERIEALIVEARAVTERLDC